jgi:hypothetical protein
MTLVPVGCDVFSGFFASLNIGTVATQTTRVTDASYGISIREDDAREIT